MEDLPAEQGQEEKVDEYNSYLNADVLWPADMPDDMLEFIVTSAKSALENQNPDTEGFKIAELLKKRLDESKLMFVFCDYCCQSMIPTGTWFWAAVSVRIASMKRTDLCTFTWVRLLL